MYRKKIAELETAGEHVAWLLCKHPHLRNCDKCLILYYWREVHGFTGELDEQKIHDFTPPETIRRVRQKIQGEFKLWLPTDPEVMETRKISEEAVRDWAVKSKTI